MICSKAKTFLALFAGGDLPARRARSVGAHLASCPDCRKELEEIRTALAKIKTAARAESAPDWSDGEWRALMVRAAGQTADAKRSGPGLRWAAVSGAAAALVMAVVMLLGPGAGRRPGLVATAPAAGEQRLKTAAEQDVVSVTLVSQETGLQVVWFFNRNFEWKGDQE